MIIDITNFVTKDNFYIDNIYCYQKN